MRDRNGVERKGDWIQTFKGNQFWPLDPRADEIDIEDIAHALSNLCRYGGHTKRFYSVAEHCVLVSYKVPKEYALDALLHDASEAYLIDVPRPIKQFLFNYKEIEAEIEKEVARKFGLEWPWHQSVKDADDRILNDERDQLMMYPPIPWGGKTVPLGVMCMGWDQQLAKAEFLARFHYLTKTR